jgi:hypothetical protein
VLALPPAHVWLIGPFHALERVKSARVSRGAKEYRRIVSRLVVHSRRRRQKAWKLRSRRASCTALSTPVESCVERTFTLQIACFCRAIEARNPH